MKLLVIGTDATIFDPSSEARKRIETYSELFEELHIVIYTLPGFRPLAPRPGLFIYPTNSSFFLRQPFDAFRIVRTLIRHHQVDLISVQDPAESGLAGWLLKQRTGLPLHIQLHADFFSPHFRRNSWKERLRYWLACFILPRGDAFRVVSGRIRTSLISRFPFLSSCITVLPIFVDPVHTAAAKPAFNLRERYPEFDFIILMVSRLVREKNIVLALEALLDLKGDFPRTGLVIIGDGPELPSLRATVERLKLDANVRFLGWQNDLYPYYKTADLYLLTSNFEGYGRSVLEAALAGVPIVMTDVGVAGELIRHDEGGLVVPVADRTALARALFRARREYPAMRHMAEKAKEILAATPPFTWQEYLRRYRDSFAIPPKPLRIIYLTNARLPTEKAHGLATMKLCEAFAREGAEVSVMHPWRLNRLHHDPYEYYRVKRNFRIRTLPSIDLLWLGFGRRFFFLLQLFSFSFIAVFWLWFRYGCTGRLREIIIFSHDHIPLYLASFFAPRIFYDVHHYPEHTFLYRRVLERSFGVAVQTKWKTDKLAEDFSIPKEKIVYWPNGTDVDRFDITLSERAVRERLRLPQDKKIVLYIGSLQRWKGVETLAATTGLLPNDVATYVVGGTQREIEDFKTPYPIPHTLNPMFVGQRPWSEMPLWLKAADIFVLPNTGKENVSRYYTSPMKLFEYMAAGKPIIASDIPSIREIIDETMAFFAVPDDPRSFAAVIQSVFANPDEAMRRAECARQEVRKYTWDARAREILQHMARSDLQV